MTAAAGAAAGFDAAAGTVSSIILPLAFFGCGLPSRRAGRLSGSPANATRLNGSPAFTLRRCSPSTRSSGGTFVRSSSRRLPKSPPTSVEITWLSI